MQLLHYELGCQANFYHAECSRQPLYSQFRVIRVGDFALNPRSLSYF